MTDRLQIVDGVIERLQTQLRDLNARQNKVMDAILADPQLAESAEQGSIGAESAANTTKIALLQQQLGSFEKRRAELEEEEAQRKIQEQRAEFKGEVFGKASNVRAMVKKRVQLARKMDDNLQAFGAALRELASLNAQIERDTLRVVRVAHMGAPHANHRVNDAVLNAQATVVEGHAADALVHMLLHNGIGRTAISAPMLFGQVGTVRPQSLEHAFEESAARANTLLTGWLYQAFGPDESQPDEIVRVRATEDGFDNVTVRLQGEVFDYHLRGGHELPRWVKRADGAPLSVPEHRPGLTTDDVRAMNPGSKVHAINPSNPLASVQPSAPTARRAGGAR